MATEASIIRRMQGALTALENRFSELFTLLGIGDIPKLKKSGTGGVLKRLLVLLRRIERVETMLGVLENEFGKDEADLEALPIMQRSYVYHLVSGCEKLHAAELGGYKNPERAVKALDKNTKVQEAIARRM